jgi:hypothetical protein
VGATQPVYWIKKRPERSVAAETFVRLLDEERERTRLLDGRRRGTARIRCVPPEVQEESDFKALPEGVPVDYFDPSFFNQLQPKLRRRITSGIIAFLPDIQKSFKWTDDEKLTDQEFLDKYGQSVLAKYNLDDLDDSEGADGNEEMDSCYADNEGELADGDEEMDKSYTGNDESEEIVDEDNEEQVSANHLKLVQHFSMDTDL